MKKFQQITLLLGLLGVVSCTTPNDPEPPVPPSQDTIPTKDTVPPVPQPVVDSLYIEDMTMFHSSRPELYRPQIHYTPAKYWVNDPNGMFYKDGVWHLYYQYNPYGNDWGNMSWGHATSTDLCHWEEQPVALKRDALGDVFSGSSVVDYQNKAGFGAGTIISFYTAAGTYQQQAMAYSVDGGYTFTRYEGNPVIPSESHDFRDPKVFYDAERDQFVMSLATGWQMSTEFWTSKDLKNWTKASELRYPITGRPSFQWECPDMIRVDGQWFLIVSVNPGGPLSGSGTMYFPGEWDGTEFHVAEGTYPLWLDYGMDNYAGVTWSNAPDDRVVFLGWMNNWTYSGLVPCSPWRSAFTLPRELHTVRRSGRTLLASTPVTELDAIAEDWVEWPMRGDTLAVVGRPAAFEAEITIPTDADNTLTFRNQEGEFVRLMYLKSSKSLVLSRSTSSGAIPAPSFKQATMTAPTYAEGDQLTLRILFDQSSIEVFTADGVGVITALCFPGHMYHQITRSAPVISCRTRILNTIW